jgi:hypothetical protein
MILFKRKDNAEILIYLCILKKAKKINLRKYIDNFFLLLVRKQKTNNV